MPHDHSKESVKCGCVVDPLPTCLAAQNPGVPLVPRSVIYYLYLPCPRTLDSMI